MSQQELRAAVPDGEGLREEQDLRPGGVAGFTDERLLVVREGEEPTSVELRDVESVEVQDLDWFEAVLGLALVGFGLASASRSAPLGGLFVALGLGSLYLTYRKRARTQVSVHSRPKPLTLYPEDGKRFYRAFERALEDYRHRLEAGDEPVVAGDERPGDGGRDG